MECRAFGTTAKGENATLYTIENGNGLSLSVSDYGATWVSLLIPNQRGIKKDVVLGFDDVRGYEDSTTFFGATVGRNANRIGNAALVIEGKTYHLDQNDNGNNLHSGLDFYNRRMWAVKASEEQRITFALHSPDGDQGYPGNVDMEVTYELTDANEVRITYLGIPDKTTVMNMTNHSYFNLSGHDGGTVLAQTVQITADAYTRADAKSIPTGEILSVVGTPMDFRLEKALGKEIEANYEALNLGAGYDHNYVLNQDRDYRKVAKMYSAESGIGMEVYTDLPGMQLYTGNFIEEEHGKNGAVYGRRHGVCFETQYFPDAVNKPMFESPIVKAGEQYRTVTGYKFIV